MPNLDGKWLVFRHKARGTSPLPEIDHDTHLTISGTSITFYKGGQSKTVPISNLTLQPDGFRRERSTGDVDAVRIGGFIWQSNGGWLMTGYIGWGNGPGGPHGGEDAHGRPLGDQNTDTFTAVKTS